MQKNTHIINKSNILFVEDSYRNLTNSSLYMFVIWTIVTMTMMILCTATSQKLNIPKMANKNTQRQYTLNYSIQPINMNENITENFEKKSINNILKEKQNIPKEILKLNIGLIKTQRECNNKREYIVKNIKSYTKVNIETEKCTKQYNEEYINQKNTEEECIKENFREVLDRNAISNEKLLNNIEYEESYEELTSEYDYSKQEEDWSDDYIWFKGEILNRKLGIVKGPSGCNETYYNLPMNGVINIMRQEGFDEENWKYSVREDGVKLFGDYVIVSADLNIYPRGTIIKTTLGMGIVCDTGEFVKETSQKLDIAVAW